jgi:hypothetical protein
LFIRQNESSSEKQPLSLQIASTMETIVEKHVLQQAGNIRGLFFELIFNRLIEFF